MIIWNRSVAGYCSPQAWKINAFDRPEKDKSTLFNKINRILLAAQVLAGKIMKSPFTVIPKPVFRNELNVCIGKNMGDNV